MYIAVFALYPRFRTLIVKIEKWRNIIPGSWWVDFNEDDLASCKSFNQSDWRLEVSNFATLGNVRGQERDLGVHFLTRKKALKMIPVGCGTKECLPFRLTWEIVASRIPYKISDLQTKRPNLIQRGKEKGQSFLPNVSEHRGEGYDDGRENVVG